MSGYRIKYRKRALNDLENILMYISADNPEKAIEFVAEMKSEIEKLASFPLLGVQNITQEYRKLIKKPYVIVYTVDEKNQTVNITYIRHGAREPI